MSKEAVQVFYVAYRNWGSSLTDIDGDPVPEIDSGPFFSFEDAQKEQAERLSKHPRRYWVVGGERPYPIVCMFRALTAEERLDILEKQLKKERSG